MADFSISYRITEKNEGGYANNSADRGGETYKGVARNYWNIPEIWNHVDKTKADILAQSGKISVRELNSRLAKNIPLQQNIVRFYKYHFWDKYNLSDVNDQKVANRLYDMIVNGGDGVVKYVIRPMLGVKAGTTLSKLDIRVINTIDSAVAIERLKDKMAQYYKNIAAKNPSQRQFLTGWLARLDRTIDNVKSVLGIDTYVTQSIVKQAVPPRTLSLLEEIEMTVNNFAKTK